MAGHKDQPVIQEADLLLLLTRSCDRPVARLVLFSLVRTRSSRTSMTQTPSWVLAGIATTKYN